MRYVALSLAVLAMALTAAWPQPSAAQTKPEPNIEEVIRKFAEAESQNKLARSNYAFTQDVEMMTLGEAGSITGRFKRVSQISLDNSGNRFERIDYFPPSTLQVSLTQEDFKDLAGVQPFALTTEDLPKYEVKYTGKERIDELNLYVFDVKPKKYEKGERYFEGRIWVDDEDVQVVKAVGKAVPEVGEQKFPRFESYRENIDRRYWFPTYVYADDILEFKSGGIRLRMIVKYTNYKKFSVDIRLVDDDSAPEEEEKAADTNKTKPATDKKPEEKKIKPPQKKP